MQDEQWMDLALEAGLLRATMAQRAPVEQARGIVMARRRVGADAALVLLRAAAERDGISLEQVGAAVVRLTTRRGDADGEPPATVELLAGHDHPHQELQEPQCGLAEPSS